MYEKAKKNVKKTAKQIVTNLEDMTKSKYTGGNFAKGKKNVAKAASNIVDNLEDLTETQKGGKGYLKSGKGMVNINMPAVDSEADEKLGAYIEKSVKKTTIASKKVKANIDVK